MLRLASIGRFDKIVLINLLGERLPSVRGWVDEEMDKGRMRWRIGALGSETDRRWEED